MANSALTSNRRTFLSAAGAIGAIAALPAFAATNPRAAWEFAETRWVDSQSTVLKYCTSTVDPIEAKYRQWFAERGVIMPRNPTPKQFSTYFDQCGNIKGDNPHTARHDAAHDEYERLLEITSGHHEKLLQMPAPDLQALRWKVSELREINDGCIVEDRDLAALLTDISRLMGDA